MNQSITTVTIAIFAFIFLWAGSGPGIEDARAQDPPAMTFFVSSAKSKTGNLGGLAGADRVCQTLADAVGLGGKTWRAYLSAEKGPANGGPVHARDRIGKGPWYNSKGALVAKNLDELHARKGDHEVFLDERGQPIPGNWPGSPKPTEHDILTGSTPEGTLAEGLTCNDWTSDSADLSARIGHADGLGRGGSRSGTSVIWNSSHDNGSCADTSPRGGAGRIYCFAVD